MTIDAGGPGCSSTSRGEAARGEAKVTISYHARKAETEVYLEAVNVGGGLGELLQGPSAQCKLLFR